MLGWGENPSTKGPVLVSARTAEVFDENQQRLGLDLVALDFEHNTVPGSEEWEKTSEPRPIAAKGKPVLVEGDGLYLDDLQWTETGRKAAEHYADVSAAVIVDDDRHVLALHSAALTRTGAVYGARFPGPQSETLSKVNGAEIVALSASVPWKVKPLAAPKEGVEGGHKSPPKGYPEDKELYADPNNYKYPIDTEEHVRAAWAYIHMPKNQEPYTREELEYIMERIRRAAKKFGIDLEEQKKESLSMEELAKPQEQLQTMQTQLEQAQPVALAAELKGLAERLAKLEEAMSSQMQAATEAQRRALLAQASAEGKVIPLSDETVAKLPLDVLSELVSKLPSQVPMGRRSGSAAPSGAPSLVNGDPREVFKQTVLKLAADRKLDVVSAIRTVIREQEQIYRAYLESGAGQIVWTN